jgi:hypothetical protein
MIKIKIQSTVSTFSRNMHLACYFHSITKPIIINRITVNWGSSIFYVLILSQTCSIISLIRNDFSLLNPFVILKSITLQLFKAFYLYMIVIQGFSLCHFQMYMYYTTIWFILSIILPPISSSFLKWHRQISMFHIHIFIERTSIIFTVFIYFSLSKSAPTLTWTILHSWPSLFLKKSVLCSVRILHWYFTCKYTVLK